MTTCYIALGSNLGDRKINIQSAIKELRKLKEIKVLKISSLLESKPQGGPRGQPDFLNGAAKIETSLTPVSLLKKLKAIENKLGRIKTVRNGPRTIDLDILLYGQRLINARCLKIPHPGLFKRWFVIKPLLEVIC